MLWLAALVAGLAVLAAGGSDDGSLPPGTAVNQQGFAEILQLARSIGLHPDYETFLVLTAYGESKGNNLVGLGDPALFPPWTKTHVEWVAKGAPALTAKQRNEANKAAVGYANNEYLRECWPREAYIFGSGGWYAFLPSTGLRVYRGTALECQHPWAVFDPPGSFVMALGMISRLRGWSTFKANPTFLALRVGWGAPGKMNDATHLKDRRKRYEEHCRALGIPVSFLNKQPPPLPAFDPVSLTQQLGGTIWLPGSV